MDGKDIQGKKFPDYGRCNYCGNDGGTDGLRDEHIIPFSLHGNTVIENASCTTCERKINPVDTHMARAVFGHYRIHAGIQTRNPKDRPTILPAQFTIDNENVSRDLPIADHPYSLALPIWGEAGFWRRASIDDPFPETFFHIYHYMPPNMRETLGLAESEDFKIWSGGRLDASLFARGIAKIAYCHTVLRFGLDGFRRLVLRDIILGKCPAVSYFVGVPLSIPPAPSDKTVLHVIKYRDITSKTSPLKLHMVSVRLFAASAHERHGMPIYHVIIAPRNYPRATRAKRLQSLEKRELIASDTAP